jgi:hypothetical protein
VSASGDQRAEEGDADHAAYLSRRVQGARRDPRLVATSVQSRPRGVPRFRRGGRRTLRSASSEVSVVGPVLVVTPDML